MEQVKKSTLADTLADMSASWLEAIRKGGAERIIGEKLLNYVGMLMIVLGGAFFLKYTHGLAGPMGKLAIGLCSGMALVVLGEYLNRDPRREAFSLPVIGGGRILVYYTVFAAYYLPAARIVTSGTLEMVLLAGTAACMIAHSLKTRSRLLTVFAFGMAYFIFAITHLGVQTLTVCTVLALAGACLVRPLRSPEVAAVNLAGFYLNYFPVFKGVLSAAGGQSLPAPEFWYSVAAAAAVHSAYAVLTPLRKADEPAAAWIDAALSLSAVLYAAAFYAQVRAWNPAQSAAGLLAIAAVLTGLSIVRQDEEKSALAAVQAFLGASVLSLGIFDLPGFANRAWGLALAPSVLATIGLWLDRRAFEKYGLIMLGLALWHWFAHWPLGEDLKPAMSLSLTYLGASAYAFALLRGSAGRQDKVFTGLWLYGGLISFLLGAWTYFESAGFVVAMFSLAMALEWGAAEFDSEALLDQAIMIETAAAVYCFFIDYGADHAVLGFMTPSRLVTTSAVICCLTAIFHREAPLGSLLGCDYSMWRRMQSWLMSAVAAYGISIDTVPLHRLPLLAGSALGLLACGRSRLPQARPAAVDFRAQAYLFLLAAAAIGVWSYQLFPAPGIDPASRAAAIIYWGSSMALLLPLAWKAWAQDERERMEEVGGQHLFAFLSLALPALYIAKQADGAHMTLCWTLLGCAYLVAGLVSRRRALRLPGLGLAGLCVFKALFVDLTGLELPYRVLSYTLLGVLLVASSYLYVQFTGKEDSDEI